MADLDSLAKIDSLAKMDALAEAVIAVASASFPVSSFAPQLKQPQFMQAVQMADLDSLSTIDTPAVASFPVSSFCC